MKRTLPDLINAGVKLVKVPVDVTELVSWCRQRGKPIDGDARAEYRRGFFAKVNPKSG